MEMSAVALAMCVTINLPSFVDLDRDHLIETIAAEVAGALVHPDLRWTDFERSRWLNDKRYREYKSALLKS